MKWLFSVITTICFSLTGLHAQTKLPLLDKSPIDMSYCPDGYPVLKIQDKITTPLTARVIYRRPQKDKRIIFGELLEYGKVWRMGRQRSNRN